MPSHISHAVALDAALDRPGSDHAATIRRLVAARSDLRAVAVLGAQGPDIFLHNHRRKPRGFRYGAILHRKGNAEVLAALATGSRPGPSGTSTAAEEGVAAFALGYISHIWMDRLFHPYINYSAGWRGTPDRHADRPVMHAFLERIIDVQLLRHERNLAVSEYRFIDRIASARGSLMPLQLHIADAIRHALWSSRDDTMLTRRLSNAMNDSLRYYRTAESPDITHFMEGRREERRGGISSRWLALLHPPEELLMVDALNLHHRRWCHPCDAGRSSNESLVQLLERAVNHTTDTFSLWCAVQAGTAPEAVLVTRIGRENLNDGITGDPPCHRRYCDPLPLLAIYQQLKNAFD